MIPAKITSEAQDLQNYLQAQQNWSSSLSDVTKPPTILSFLRGSCRLCTPSLPGTTLDTLWKYTITLKSTPLLIDKLEIYMHAADCLVNLFEARYAGEVHVNEPTWSLILPQICMETINFFLKTKQKQSLYNPSNNLLLSMIFCELFPELQSSMFLFIMVKYILGTSYQGTNLINFSSITAPWFSSER